MWCLELVRWECLILVDPAELSLELLGLLLVATAPTAVKPVDVLKSVLGLKLYQNVMEPAIRALLLMFPAR